MIDLRRPVTLLQGHVIDRLRDLPDESVHCVVTSPPYWALRDYATEPQVWLTHPAQERCEHRFDRDCPPRRGPSQKQGATSQRQGRSNVEAQVGRGREQGAYCECGAWRGELGLEPDLDQFIAHVVQVFREVWRVLRPEGTLWLNFGDCYASNVNGWDSGRYRNSDDRTFRNKPASSISSGLKPKDLAGVPWRVAFALQADGWWLRSDIIWAKRSPMPQSVSGWTWERHRVKVGPGPSGHSGKDGNYSGAGYETEWADCPGCKRCEKNGGLVLSKGSGRPTTAHEYLFLLAKSDEYYYDLEAVREPFAEASAAELEDEYRGNGQKDYAENGVQNPSDVKRRTVEVMRRNGGRNKRSVWLLSTEPSKTSARTVRRVPVARDAADGDTKRITSPDCPLHGSKGRLHPTASCDEHSADVPTRTEHTCDHHGQELHGEHVPIAQPPAPNSEGQSSGLAAPVCSGSATERSTGSRKKDLAPETNPPCSASAQTRGHIGGTSEEHAVSGSAGRNAVSNTERGGLADHPLEQTQPRIEDTSSLDLSSCTCEFYREIAQGSDHFATFPSKLVEPCILAGSATQVCGECGAPYAPVVEVDYSNPGNRTTNGPRSLERRHETPGFEVRLERETRTLGYRPSCRCEAEPTAAVVLDPFCGSGTVGEVALKHGRHFVGIDLQPAYLNDIARPRLAACQSLFTGTLDLELF